MSRMARASPWVTTVSLVYAKRMEIAAASELIESDIFVFIVTSLFWDGRPAVFYVWALEGRPVRPTTFQSHTRIEGMCLIVPATFIELFIEVRINTKSKAISEKKVINHP